MNGQGGILIWTNLHIPIYVGGVIFTVYSFLAKPKINRTTIPQFDEIHNIGTRTTICYLGYVFQFYKILKYSNAFAGIIKKWPTITKWRETRQNRISAYVKGFWIVQTNRKFKCFVCENIKIEVTDGCVGKWARIEVSRPALKNRDSSFKCVWILLHIRNFE